MTDERSRRPASDRAFPNQAIGDFQHDRRDVPIGEEIPAITEGLGVVLLLFVERCHEDMQRLGIDSKQVRSQSGVGPDPQSADEFASFAFDKQLAAEAVKGLLAACHANLAVLDVAMRDSVGMAVGMTWLAEPELERQLLPRV